MKQFKIVALILLTIAPHLTQAGFGGFAAQQASNSSQAARNSYLRSNQTASSTTPTTCPACPTTNSSSYYIPTFSIILADQNGTTLSTHNFNTPTTFNLSNVLFSVHIFPKSNSINAGNITYATGDDGTYIVAYTLKDPAGSMVYKEFDLGLTLKNLPHQINLIPTAATTPATSTTATTTSSAPQAGTWTTSTTASSATVIAQSIFIPTLPTSTLTTAQRQQIINGISPISQKFLFSLNGTSYTASPISGTYDADDSQSTTSLSLAITPAAATTATSGSNIGQIGIAFNDASSNSITFANRATIAINHADLAQGLLLNVCIFPSTQDNNYPVVATLRTIDGLKLHKQSAISTASQSNANALTTMPTTVTIQYTPTTGSNAGTAQNILTTSFLNSSVSNTIFNLVSPVNLRFAIMENNGNISVNMV